MASFAAILAIGKPVAFDASADGPRHPRVHLDDDHPAGLPGGPRTGCCSRRCPRRPRAARRCRRRACAGTRGRSASSPARRSPSRRCARPSGRCSRSSRRPRRCRCGRASARARTPSSRARSPRSAPRAPATRRGRSPASRSSSSGVCAMPEPRPPMVNDGRITTGRPSSATRGADLVHRVAHRAARHLARRSPRTMSLNFCRSSPRWIASMSAPISSTSYFSSTPRSCSAIAVFSAVCPPSVARIASGRSRR